MKKSATEIIAELRGGERVIESQLIPDRVVHLLDQLADEGKLERTTVHQNGVPLRSWHRPPGAIL